MKTNDHTRTSIRLLSVALVTTLIVSVAAPAMASALNENRSAITTQVKFASQLDPIQEVPALQVAKAIVPVESAEAPATPARPARPAPKAKAPLPKPVAPAPAVNRTTTSAARSTSSGSAPAATKQAAAAAPTPASSGGISQARSILSRYISTYPILRGTTVDFGDTKGNGQAIAYYKSGRIVINPNHTASLERIIAHEIWHIIDWRDNSQIDWGESVPPANANDFKG